MKRLFIAAGLLLLTAALCVFSHCALERGVDRLLLDLAAVETAYSIGGQVAAAPEAARFAAAFEKETRWFPLFLPHEQLDAAAQCAVALPARLAAEDTAFEAELARCRRLLQDLADSERLTAENIL